MVSLRSMSPVRAGALLLAVIAVAALTIGIVWQGRSPSSERTLPLWPQGVEEPDEYPFGDGVMLRDHRAWQPVFDTLGERFGSARLRIIHLTLDANADVEALRDHFDGEMVDRRHWHAVTQETGRRGAWAFGYETSDGRDVFMLVGLEPRPGDTLVPLNIITTLHIPGRW